MAKQNEFQTSFPFSVKIFYQPLDEDTRAYYMPQTVIKMMDSKNFNIHTWTIDQDESGGKYLEVETGLSKTEIEHLPRVS